MMMKKIVRSALVLIALQFALHTSVAEAARSNKRIGLAVGFLTEPYPSVVGYSLSYNISDRLRATFGYGSISFTGTSYTIDVTTIAVDAKFFLLDWTFAPFINGGFTSISGTITGTGSTGGLSISSTGTAPTIGFGLDWQAGIGFNFGVDYKILFKNGQAPGAPGVYFGWYF